MNVVTLALIIGFVLGAVSAGVIVWVIVENNYDTERAFDACMYSNERSENEKKIEEDKKIIENLKKYNDELRYLAVYWFDSYGRLSDKNK